ncbi:hypothetical protein [Actinomadura madurae]|uniref:hypothetical protein n=1 Tax=Actinomadura madurae TaxID=1993 RepID=UPI0020D215C7|nr:hypothetical protein [Actinomadura madurae]MCP9978866.1 hypothetical protein [Actinomadura madurae]
MHLLPGRVRVGDHLHEMAHALRDREPHHLGVHGVVRPRVLGDVPQHALDHGVHQGRKVRAHPLRLVPGDVAPGLL